MIWVNIKRIFRSGFISFWRHGVVSLASVLAIIITLVVVGSLLLGSAYLDSTLESFKQKVDISISFKTDAAEDEILSIKNTLASLPEVKLVDYISRDKELADFTIRHQDNAVITQSLEEVGNPFGARLNVSAKDPSQYESIVRFLDNSENSTNFNKSVIDQITFKQDIINRLIKLVNITREVGFAVSLVLILMSILVTFNTISLAIYISREEIAVMRLVGASNTYVTGPFIIEGAIAGIFSSIVAMGLLYPISLWITNTTKGAYNGINLLAYYVDNFAQIFQARHLYHDDLW
ncbi:MAG: permease-like cell division protein FtsX, partial [Patescibacteria group bacterium]